MGIGNYTEQDIKECARAFTGWTLGNAEYMAVRASKDSIWPYGRISWHFGYRPEDHDDGEKTFLGETGRFNGEDIIDIIARQPATARFICKRLFQFFAADEVDEEGEGVIKAMEKSYFDSGYEIRSVLRTLFNSDYFKSERSRFARVKGPVEYVVGAIRRAGSYRVPTYGADKVAEQASFMGQGLLNPPTVEGWHEGTEWIDSGAPSRACQLRCQRARRRLQARSTGAHRPARQAERWRDVAGNGSGPLSRPYRAHRGLRRYALCPDRARGDGGRPRSPWAPTRG